LPKWFWNAIEGRWEEGFSHLVRFIDREKHARVPQKFKTKGFTLGNWVGTNRKNKDSLTPDKIKKLDELPGWSWSLLTERWEEGFLHLVRFVDREKHARVPQKFKTENGYNLGIWVSAQRLNKRDNKLTQDRIDMLDSVIGWSWDVLKEKWEEGFSHLVRFVDREKHARVPQSFKLKNGYNLGIWVSTQRLNKDSLTPDQIKRLDELPKWFWNAITGKWEEGFLHLVRFVDREKHARVKATFITEDGFLLGKWVSRQRRQKDSLTKEQFQKLLTLEGWNWDFHMDRWEKTFSCLVRFVKTEGSSKVPRVFKTENGNDLAIWVKRQRMFFRKNKLSPDQIKKLESIKGWVWEANK
jgi:hypothetical protein